MHVSLDYIRAAIVYGNILTVPRLASAPVYSVGANQPREIVVLSTCQGRNEEGTIIVHIQVFGSLGVIGFDQSPADPFLFAWVAAVCLCTIGRMKL